MLEKSIPYFKKLNGISNSVIITYPNTILSADQTVLANINLEEIGEEEFEKFGIYNLAQFLNIVNFMGDVQIEKEDNKLIIKNDNQKQIYETTNILLLKNVSVKPEIFQRVKSVESCLKFDLNEDDIKHIKKISGILNHQHVIIDNEKITVTTLDANNNYQNPYIYKKDIMTNETARFVFDIMNFNKIPEGNYEFHIKRNPKTKNPIAYLNNIEEPFELIIAISKEI